MKESQSTVYFGYGSNLWRDQMQQRCPTSQYLGIARLKGYQWIINDRGYANVVENDSTAAKKASSNEVWGLVYRLQPDDEDALDINEGVPRAYTKEDLVVDFWPADKNGKTVLNVEEEPERMNMLVYIDRKRMLPAMPKKEYIYRMNMGIRDALKEGVPARYVDGVLRKFIPDKEDEKVASFARQQAAQFEDE